MSISMDVRPHAYDPDLNPELFEGVLARRIIAFFIDFICVGAPIALAAVFLFIASVVFWNFAGPFVWLLFFYWLLPPASVIWAIVYFGLGVAGERSATIGMRVMDLEMRTWYGAPAYFVLGAVHVILFWISVSALTPFILLVAFFNRRRRLLHDIVLGTVIVNNPQRAAALRGFATSPV